MGNNFAIRSLVLPVGVTSNILNMISKKNNFSKGPGFSYGLFISILFFYGQQTYAQSYSPDSSKRTLLASLDKKATANYFVKEANVVFPEILKGSEEEATDYIERFSNRRKDYLVRMYKNGRFLLPKAAAILKKHNLPEELKVLLTLESAYNANAVSSAGAVGYWQFMDAVAKEYGLKYAVKQKTVRKKIVKIRGKKILGEKIITKKGVRQKDDRKNFDKATTAAARYLHDRRLNLADNWLLVVASYNCGVGNVWSAMEKSGKDDPTFWDIKDYLPAETQAYVMNFITLNVIFANYDNFIKNNLLFKAVKIEIPEISEQNMSDAPDGNDAVQLK